MQRATEEAIPMYKYVSILLAAFIASSSAIAEDADGLIIVRTAPQQKNALYDQTIIWAAARFSTPGDAVTHKDKQLGTIVANGKLESNGIVSNVVSFSMRIEVKDKKYRMIFSNVVMKPDGMAPMYFTKLLGKDAYWNKRFEEIANDLDSFLKRSNKDF
jgi:hypothetical protein